VEKKYDYCVLLSGPEPQRSLLENKFIRELPSVAGNCLLVRGKPGSTEQLTIGPNVTVVNHLPGPELEAAIRQSAYVISRSGYSTVMELLALRKKAILIPTPGQTEQEYLARRLQSAGICLSFTQEDFNATQHLPLAHAHPYQFPTLTLFHPDMLPQLLQKSLSK